MKRLISGLFWQLRDLQPLCCQIMKSQDKLSFSFPFFCLFCLDFLSIQTTLFLNPPFLKISTLITQKLKSNIRHLLIVQETVAQLFYSVINSHKMSNLKVCFNFECYTVFHQSLIILSKLNPNYIKP